MTADRAPDQLVVQRILEQLLEDRVAGTELSLAEYQGRFPGHEQVVAEQYSAIFAAPTPTETPPQLHELGLPERFGRYRVVGLLGAGGQGVVYRTLDETLDREVAVKVLAGAAALSVEALARFATEARLASRLDHPNICKILDVLEHQGRPVLAMQYIEGRSLEAYIEELQRSWPERSETARRQAVDDLVTLFAKVARAAHFAHQRGVVHRDLKPANILLDRDHEPVILDFGIARSLDDDDIALTRTGATPGTPAYAAPEQLGTTPHEPDPRTDVWALGVSLYEALALGRRPFEAQTLRDLERAILHTPHPPLRESAPWVRPDLSMVIDAAMRKDLRGRYASAELLAEDLHRVLEQRPIRAQPISNWTRTVLWTRRNRALATAIALVTLTLSAATVVSTWYAVAAERSLASRTRVDDRRAGVELATTATALLGATPAVPGRLDDFESWLGAAQPLLTRLDGYRSERDRLRAEAERDTAGEQQTDWHRRETGPRAELLELLTIRRDAPRLTERTAADFPDFARRANHLKQKVDRTPAEHREYENRAGRWLLMQETKRLAAEQLTAADPERERELQAVIAEQARYSHRDPAADERLQELSRAVAALEALRHGDEGDLVELVRQRRNFARELAERIGGTDAELWARCSTSVGNAEGSYAGLQLDPIPGLVPLGIDQDSGLWEFWHIASGERPTWAGEPCGRGRAVIDAGSDNVGMVLVLIPGGNFTMGTSFALQPRTAGAYEVPTAEVELAPFLIAKHEVTQAQWQHAGSVNVSERRAGSDVAVDGSAVSPRTPVDRMTWQEARAFCEKLDLELPTEAQWEFACRAGSSTGFPGGGDSAALQGYANVLDQTFGSAFDLTPTAQSRTYTQRATWKDGFAALAPAGSFRANGFGLHDTWGNASEWVLDRFFVLDERRPRPGDGLRGTLVANRSRTIRSSSAIVPLYNAGAYARRGVNEGDRPTYNTVRPSRNLDPRPMH